MATLRHKAELENQVPLWRRSFRFPEREDFHTNENRLVFTPEFLLVWYDGHINHQKNTDRDEDKLTGPIDILKKVGSHEPGIRSRPTNLFNSYSYADFLFVNFFWKLCTSSLSRQSGLTVCLISISLERGDHCPRNALGQKTAKFQEVKFRWYLECRLEGSHGSSLT